GLRNRLPQVMEAAELFLAGGVALVCDHLGLAPPFGRLDPVYLLVEVAGIHDPTEELAEAVVDGVGDRALDGAVGADPAGRAWLHLNRSPAEIDVFRAIKAALDPDGILNPYVLLPEGDARTGALG